MNDAETGKLLLAESPRWSEAELVQNSVSGLPVLCAFSYTSESQSPGNLGPVQFK